jgi:hypothetical protein
MQLVISPYYNHLSVRCMFRSTLAPLSYIHLLTIQTPFLQADVDSR